jgi:Ran GTPase-activating protein (RanGAP) involved in mRNA processing and transport
VLKIEHCKISEDSILNLVRCLNAMSEGSNSVPAIQTLSLVDANFRGYPEVLTNLAGYLVKNKHLKSLNLSWNEFGNQDQMHSFLTSLLSAPNKIQSLNLSFNKLFQNCEAQEDGVENPNCFSAMSMYIRENTKLQHLDLSNTCLGGAHFPHLLKACISSVSLQSVHLCSNPLVESIEATTELQTLQRMLGDLMKHIQVSEDIR